MNHACNCWKSIDFVYCPTSTSTVVLGLLCNVDTSQRTVDVKIESDTNDTEKMKQYF